MDMESFFFFGGGGISRGISRGTQVEKSWKNRRIWTDLYNIQHFAANTVALSLTS